MCLLTAMHVFQALGEDNQLTQMIDGNLARVEKFLANLGETNTLDDDE